MKKVLSKIVLILLASMAIVSCSKDDDSGSEEISSVKQILSFVFPEESENFNSAVTASINEDAKTITVVLPYGTDITNLTPNLDVLGATVSPTGAQDFTEPVVYTITAENGSVVTYTTTITVAGPLPFVTTWQTTTANESITIYINPDITGYNYTIDWGDETVQTGLTTDGMHTYTDAGTYEVSISGDFPAIYQYFNLNNNTEKLLTIESWGDIEWKSMENAFTSCDNMIYNAIDVPNLTEVTNMSNMFSSASAFNGDISSWNVGSVTDMGNMFSGASTFNGDISNWNVSNVKDMSGMFIFAEVFNGDISNWDVSSVTNMHSMFNQAPAFNGDISKWSVSNVTDMGSMFQLVKAFNRDINSWDVSNVTDMSQMFTDASAFNQNISGWNVGNVTTMQAMFAFTSNFNQDISDWDIGSVTNMGSMFWGASAFNRDLSGWYTVKVTACSGFNTNSGLDNDQLPTAGNCF